MKANAELLMFKDAELQMIKNNQVDHYEHKENDVVDFLSAFMKNPGFKRIADNLLSFLDSKSFNRCRLVCRPWKDYIDNEWSMLQLQIFHVTRSENGTPLKGFGLKFGPLFKIMEKTTNKSELRIFIQMCREMVSGESGDCNRKLERDPLVYMIDHHRHQELNMLLHCPIPSCFDIDSVERFTRIFKYSCQFGCVKCVKTILDRSEEKEIGNVQF